MLKRIILTALAAAFVFTGTTSAMSLDEACTETEQISKDAQSVLSIHTDMPAAQAKVILQKLDGTDGWSFKDISATSHDKISEFTLSRGHETAQEVREALRVTSDKKGKINRIYLSFWTGSPDTAQKMYNTLVNNLASQLRGTHEYYASPPSFESKAYGYMHTWTELSSGRRDDYCIDFITKDDSVLLPGICYTSTVTFSHTVTYQ